MATGLATPRTTRQRHARWSGWTEWQPEEPSDQARGLCTDPARGPSRPMWMVGDVSVVREQFREAAWTLGLPLLVLDWTEADDRVATDGCPEGVILTDWDLAVDPDDSYLFVTRCSRVLVCYSGPLDSLSAQWLERPNLEILPLPLDVEDFEQAIAWLAGEAVEADWSGSKTALGVVLP